jgi:hypothetical protein
MSDIYKIMYSGVPDQNVFVKAYQVPASTGSSAKVVQSYVTTIINSNPTGNISVVAFYLTDDGTSPTIGPDTGPDIGMMMSLSSVNSHHTKFICPGWEMGGDQGMVSGVNNNPCIWLYCADYTGTRVAPTVHIFGVEIS